MTPTRRRLPVLVLVASAVWPLLCTGGALAADQHISAVTPVGADLSMIFSARTTGSGLDANTVRASVAGRQLLVTGRPIGAQPATRTQRRVVLLVDSSGSMAGTGLDGAKRAAVTYLAKVPADVQVGLVAVSDRPTLLAAPTLNRGEVRAAVSGLTAQGGTTLYDGLAVALTLLGNTGERRIVLLSDGADTGSHASPAAVTAALRRAHVVLDAVGFRTANTATNALQQLADASGGHLVTAQDAAGLSAAFTTAAAAFTSQLAITVHVPADLAGQTVTLLVSVHAGKLVFSERVPTRLPGGVSLAPSARPRPAALPPARGSGLALQLGLGGLFLGLLLITYIGLQSRSPQRRDKNRMTQVMAQYTNLPRPQAALSPTALGESRLARNAVEWAGRLVQRRGMDERLALKLDRAGFTLRPAEWLLIHVTALMTTALLAALLSGNLVAGLVGGLLGFTVPMAWLTLAAGRRRTAFQNQLPDTLQLIASSLSSGYSFPQALDSVIREGDPPMAAEIGRALAEARLGVPIEDALDKVADRMDSVDLRWTVMAVRVQADVGGNLAEVLAIVAKTMRDRAQLRRHVRALSAEGRLSAYVLVGLPIGISAFTFTFRREYMHPLYTDPIGIIMSAAAIILVVTGALWMKKLVKVEV